MRLRTRASPHLCVATWCGESKRGGENAVAVLKIKGDQNEFRKINARIECECAGCWRPVARSQPRQRRRRQRCKRLLHALRLATTTSTQDSGLLEFLLPDFEKQAGVKVDVVAVGTGAAIKLGEDGNADVLLVHARAQEDAFMKAEHGVRREDVMYNDFVIVGPASDPAKIKGMPSAADALKTIAAAGAPFISRGDKSGTHTKELAVWKAAGLEPKGAWYRSAGQGMGAVLNMAQEQQAYTISDRATYLTRAKADLKLVVLVEGDKSLFNPYGVIAVNPRKTPP